MHDYVYGLQFELETDHKPLVAISKKSLADMTPRIQRKMMKLQRYDYIFNYTPGKKLLVADALSRSIKNRTSENSTDMEREVTAQVDLVMSTIPATDNQLKKIAIETQKDSILQKVIQCIHSEWTKNQCKQYYPFREEISQVDGILLKGTRIIIPVSMRCEMLQRLHDGHMGIEKTKQMARDTIYWPGMNSDIDNLTANCATCLKHRYKQVK